MVSWNLFVAAAALRLFIPAWTFDYWQAWVFLLVFFLPALAITIECPSGNPIFQLSAPSLLGMRLRSPTKWCQVVLGTLAKTPFLPHSGRSCPLAYGVPGSSMRNQAEASLIRASARRL